MSGLCFYVCGTTSTTNSTFGFGLLDEMISRKIERAVCLSERYAWRQKVDKVGRPAFHQQKKEGGNAY